MRWVARLCPPTLRGWTARDLAGDLASGLMLAAIAIPEQMATARLGGFAPQVGFTAFAAASVAFALFGANRRLSSGADSTITPLFAGSLALIATTGSTHYAELAAVLALLVGITVLASGLFRLGWIADLLSVPVTTGFLAGISVHIVVSQLPGLLGLPAASGETLQRINVIAENIHLTNPDSLALGTLVFAIVTGAERISARIPGALIGVLLATSAAAALGLAGRDVAVLGPLPGGMPQPQLPSVSAEDLQMLLPIALLVGIVVMVQTAATSRSFVPNERETANVNRDFIGVGAGSIVSGLFGAFPVNASPPRTAIVAETGGTSQVAGLVAAAMVLAVGIFGGALLANVPQAALAGVLLFVAFRILRFRVFADIYRRAFGEFVLIVLTMAAIVILPIQTGVAIGIGLSLLHGLWSVTRARAIELEKVPGSSVWWPPQPGQPGEHIPGLLVVAFQAPLSFVNANIVKRDLCEMIDAAGRLKLVILESSNIVEIDYTAARALMETVAHCRASGAAFAIARLESVRAQEALGRLGVLDAVGAENIFRSVDDAVRHFHPRPAASTPAIDKHD